MKVRYFGTSADTPDTNARFAASLGIDFPILSDSTREVARSYGVVASSGYPARWTFYIGVDGRILDIDLDVSPRSHGRDVVAKLRELEVPVTG